MKFRFGLGERNCAVNGWVLLVGVKAAVSAGTNATTTGCPYTIDFSCNFPCSLPFDSRFLKYQYSPKPYTEYTPHMTYVIPRSLADPYIMNKKGHRRTFLN